MKQIPPNKQLVALPLDELVEGLLQDNHYITVSQTVADTLHLVTKNKHTVYVQYPGDRDIDILGRHIEQPVLWRHARWLDSTERWMKSKLRAEEERAAKFVLDENIRRVSKMLCRQLNMLPEHAHVVAFGLVHKKQEDRIIAIGGRKLLTSVDEI